MRQTVRANRQRKVVRTPDCVIYNSWTRCEPVAAEQHEITFYKNGESSYVSDSMMISASSINTLSLYKSLTLVF